MVRLHIRDLKPYSSARDEFSGEAEVYLDANENSLGSVGSGAFNRYPDPLQRAVKERLAALKGVEPGQIFLGNGSDEAIDLLYRAFCEPKRDHVLLLPPTYGMYQVCADLNQVKAIPVPLTADFQLPLGELVAALRPGTKMIFLCSPNNPTGNLLDKAQIRRLLEKTQALVVVDEAYGDFAPEGSVLPLLAHFPHLVVLQTFSKAWGLAGLRLGMAFAHPDVIAVLNRIKPPYNVNLLTQQHALAALAEVEAKDQMVADILAGRAWLEAELAGVKLVRRVYPSDANFLLVQVDDAPRRYRELVQRGVIVRDRSRVTLCDQCLRITVGTATENTLLIGHLHALSGD
ncbi:MAG: histidinol-phosphate transaminase [Bacteroidia bacterium]